MTFEYQPLCEGESTARLVIYATELGHFFYELQLKALPAPFEKPLYFRAPLGSKHSVIAKFTNFSRVKTEYICKVGALFSHYYLADFIYVIKDMNVSIVFV